LRQNPLKCTSDALEALSTTLSIERGGLNNYLQGVFVALPSKKHILPELNSLKFLRTLPIRIRNEKSGGESCLVALVSRAGFEPATP
jgi:hypothetical protein